jgi:hypothetical protein
MRQPLRTSTQSAHFACFDVTTVKTTKATRYPKGYFVTFSLFCDAEFWEIPKNGKNPKIFREIFPLFS